MDLETLRLLEHVHGHLGWLSVAALCHPAILLRPKLRHPVRHPRRARWAVASAVTLATCASTIGGVIYYDYSHQLRRLMYVASRTQGLLFERKEHLAFAALTLAWSGAIVHLFAEQGTEEEKRSRARFVHWVFVASALMAATVAVLGTIVAAFKTF